ncbi:DUF3253 domain-containing protein [Sneathiella sp. HT1-7]|uniref:DUF3253 domain-containing protein n=1 Tax=Sneathiella sp. HT1-7 TaxID=2887192 RepID=UPI001D137482|nr:DUF3253 domain-containing protein [Sneathiella sp. HT1-7]MCC3306153.1 DUF3253 domain-containing protein [Sneathiella sp. HT1-7]
MTDDTNKADNADKPEIEDDPVVDYILDAVASGGDIAPQEIAQAIAGDRLKSSSPKDAWRKYMTAVRQQAIHLARDGRLHIIRKGKIADPNDFKGLYKLRKVSGD